MHPNTNIDTSVKTRVLIADDSRIVRATLIKHIQGVFEFREALDGEQAWEALLIDPTIRVLITDLTMPKLDGYGLLRRIRGSKISRIRNIPVVVVSGSDEQEERDRARAAGATDLITKGIGTAQLLSRLDILSKLVNAPEELKDNPGVGNPGVQTFDNQGLASIETFEIQAKGLLEKAVGRCGNFVVLNVGLGLTHSDLAGMVEVPSAESVNAVRQLLQRIVRQADVVAQVDEAAFTLASCGIQSDFPRNFAQRIWRAIIGVSPAGEGGASLVASCGMASLPEFGDEAAATTIVLTVLRDIASRRANLGLIRCEYGVVGVEEEARFLGVDAGPAEKLYVNNAGDFSSPTMSTFVQWIKEGKREQVQQHMRALPAELRSLLRFMLQQSKH